MTVVKIIELMSESDVSFDDAIKSGVKKASKTIHNITGVDVLGQKLVVENNKIKTYKAHLKVAFVVEK